jgi:hypothetical protein
VLRFGKLCQSTFFFCVWKKRNLKCFKDLESSIDNILALFFCTLYLLTVAFLSPLSLSFVDFFAHFFLSS